MKSIAIIILACLSVISCKKSYFTGVVESDIRLTLLVDTLNVNDFIATNGTKITGIYNNGCFVYKMNAENIEVYFFNVNTGKYYLKAKNSDELSYWDKDYSLSKVSGIKVKRNDTTIMGYPCDKIEYYETFANSSLKVFHKAYYNQGSFSINPDWYKDLKLGGYNEIMRITQAIPLLDIAEYPWIRFEYAATKVISDTTVDVISIIKKYEDSYPNKRAY